MTQRSTREMLNDVARDRIPDTLDLLPRVAAQYAKQKGPMMKPLYKFALAGVLVLAVLVVTAFAVPSVATGMRQVLGYIPGLGLVEQGEPLRVLAEPVMVERAGVRVIVEKASSDSQRTIMLVSVDGIPSPDKRIGCADGSPLLRLPDGKILPVNEASGFGHETGYNQRMVFAALPDGAEKVTLELPCLLMTDSGKAPEAWQIPMVFAAADPSQASPVIELPPQPSTAVKQPGDGTQEAAQAAPQAAAPAVGETAPKAVESPYGITLTLEKVAELEDGYILIGSMSWTDPSLGDYGVSSTNPILLDADGQPVPFDYYPPDLTPAPGSKQTYWAYKVQGKEHRWPLTLKSGADIMMALPEQPSFPLDLSSPPAPGQSKDVNATLEAAGHTLQVLSYSTDKDPEGNGVLNFKVQADPSVIGLSLFDAEHPVLGGGGGGGGGSNETREPIQVGFTYNGSLPTGSVRISITMLMLYIEGDWSVTWQP